ncbi:MAG: diguanylate cyclase [Gammaproteobacteria bacterium]|nr:diguanylate cyclase [Gammaproteobacteria bacterium]MBU1731906.1 diguanylate cyclase [Gammaproteobacteria bacterium]MBU1891420.1 diguanylate cyclase [Gammaproteobacteria bacterium]
MPDLSPETDSFIAEFDAAIEAHMDWSRRILRCAVLHSSPGEDVLAPMAHTLCRFGRWFHLNRAHFEAIDVDSVQHIDAVHKAMHDTIRAICADVMTGRPGQSADLEVFERSQSELLTQLARLKTLTLSNAVRHDPLTGLPLRYGIESDFSLCQKDARRNRTLLYVAMIDVDHFKLINDNHGHPEGDMVLRHLAGTLKKSLRGNDPLYRFGGEEFLWLMRCQSAEEAEQSARRIVATISSTPVPITNNEPLALTVTLGLALVGEQEDIASAIKRADMALYEGKKAGRNRYVIAD